MTFAGLDLGALAAWIAIPGAILVALHLLRVRRRAVRVAHLPLWAATLGRDRATALFGRLRSPGSLLLQLLLVTALALALGDPWLGGPEAAGCRHVTPETAADAAPRHHVVLIDTSASMGALDDGRSRLEQAIGAAREAIADRLAEPGARVLVATFDAHPRVLTPWTTELAAVEPALARLSHTPLAALGTDLPAALRFASEALAAARTPATAASLAVVSDFATLPPGADSLQLQLLQQQGSPTSPDPGRSTSPSSPPTPPGPDTGRSTSPSTPTSPETPSLPAFTPIPVGGPADNLAVTAFNLRPLPDDPLTYVAWYTVAARVPSKPGQPLTADLFLYANPEGRTAADFESPAWLIHTERVTLPAEGTLSGRLPALKFDGDRVMVRLAPAASSELTDALAADDRAFAVTPPRRRLSVLLVTAGNTFLEAALGLRENLELTRVAPEAWDGTARPDVVVLDGVARHPAHRGPALRIAPPDLPTTRTASDVRVREPRLAPRASGGPSPKHRLVRHLGTADWGIEAMAVLATQKTDRVYLASEAGDPVLWERSPDDAAQRELILSFDLKRSLLPVSVAFPVLMVEALNHLADEPDGIRLPLPTGHPDGLTLPAAAAGQPVTVTPPKGEPMTLTARADGPSGLPAPVASAPSGLPAPVPAAPSDLPAPVASAPGAQASDSDGASVSVDLTASGLYTATFTPGAAPGPAAARTVVFAVNPGDPRESALTPETDRWQPAPEADDARAATSAASEEAAQTSAPTPIWRWLLLAALALVTLEQLLLPRRWLT